MSKDFEPKLVNIFLLTILYMCFGFPKEPSKGDGDCICFGWEIKKKDIMHYGSIYNQLNYFLNMVGKVTKTPIAERFCTQWMHLKMGVTF